MFDSKARWAVKPVDDQLAAAVVTELGLPPLLARLLATRGLANAGEAALFLSGDSWHDPYLLDGMAEAVARIRLALSRGERIWIYGDYDADGVSSTSLMIRLLEQMEARFDYYIPHRVHEGYGLNRKALEQAAKQGITLVVTVDTGISAIEEIAYASELGIDVVVTDHHEPPEQLPAAAAIVNPKKPGCPYPFKGLAGVGVAFKLAHALLGKVPEELAEFAALGTVADLMPLTGENRTLVKLGVQRMRRSKSPGLRALAGVCGVELRELNEQHIAFAIAPRVNAGGRLERADMAVKLLTTDHEQEAEHLAHDLDQLNKERQRIVEQMTKEADAMVAAQAASAFGLPGVLVVAKEGWNVGVLGIVASKLLERYYRPTLVFGMDESTGLCKGSARSIPGYDLHKALTACEELLEHYGGHQAAAGLTIKQELLEPLRERLAKLASEWLHEEDYVAILEADAECTAADATLSHAAMLEQLAPFGNGNPNPRFLFAGAQVAERRTMGRDQQHLKLMVGEEGALTEAVGFGFGAMLDWIAPGSRIDVLGELSVSEWNGVRKPQILIRDMRIASVQAFDWRGSKQPEVRIAELCGGLPEGRGGQEMKPCVIWFPHQGGFQGLTAGELARLQERWGPHCALRIWQEGEGCLMPMNEVASRPYAEDTDIVLYNLPSSVESAVRCLEAAVSVKRVYALFRQDDVPSGGLPSRDSFKAVYTLLRSLERPLPGTRQGVEKLGQRAGISPDAVQCILDVFNELEVVVRSEEGYRCMPNPVKKDLSTSSLYRYKMEMQNVERQLVFSSASELTQWMLGLLNREASHPSTIPESLEEIV